MVLLVPCRRCALAVGLLSLVGCNALNPKFDETSTSGTASSALSSSSSNTTSGPGASSSDSGTTKGPPGPITTLGTTLGATLGTTMDVVDGSSTDSGPLFDLGDDGPEITLFASVVVEGNFAVLSGGLEIAGPQICATTADLRGLALDCETVFPILGWAAQPLPSLPAVHPALDGAAFVDVDGQEIAADYSSLLEGLVSPDFGPRVTAHLSASSQFDFWWGYSVPENPDCGGWAVLESDGIARFFSPMGVSDLDASCLGTHSLLCACVPN